MKHFVEGASYHICDCILVQNTVVSLAVSVDDLVGHLLHAEPAADRVPQVRVCSGSCWNVVLGDLVRAVSGIMRGKRIITVIIMTR